jgi:hypothetical protein
MSTVLFTLARACLFFVVGRGWLVQRWWVQLWLVSVRLLAALLVSWPRGLWGLGRIRWLWAVIGSFSPEVC